MSEAIQDPAPPDGIVFDEFEPDDPRRGPHTPDVMADAAAQASTPKRWHVRKPRVDWFAVRLQCGRGQSPRDVARTFGIGRCTIDRRRYDEEWIPVMAEADRRHLSILVWLAGVERLDPDNSKDRETLKAASEWRLKKDPDQLIWRPKNPRGEPFRFTFNDPSR